MGLWDAFDLLSLSRALSLSLYEYSSMQVSRQMVMGLHQVLESLPQPHDLLLIYERRPFA